FDPVPRPSLGAGIQVADLLLYRRGLLESGGSRPVRVLHQPPDRPLLHAGPQYHLRARAHGAVRSLRHVGPGTHPGTHAVLPAWAHLSPLVENQGPCLLLLVDHYLSVHDGADYPTAHRIDAYLGD